MNLIIAALDNRLGARPVMTTARAVAPLLGAEVEAVHVAEDGDRTARQAAEAAGIPLRIVQGPLVKSLVEAGRPDEVVAMVIGARSMLAGPRPLGSTALAVATSLPKPIVVVPPDAEIRETIRRVLVPLEAAERSANYTPRGIIELAQDTELDMIGLHVYQEDSLPAFTDQPQHEREAWGREFIRRYARWRSGTIRLETRVGRAADLLPVVAEEVDADLVALGWSRELGAGHAPVVRGVLERCRRPVLLVPILRSARVGGGRPVS